MEIKIGDTLDAIVKYKNLLTGCVFGKIHRVEIVKITGILFKLYSCKLDDEDGTVIRLYKSDFLTNKK